MINFIYSTPTILLFLLLNFVMIFISVFIIYIIDKVLNIHCNYMENTAIGSASASIATIFAVITGFASLYVLNNFHRAEEVVQLEANLVMSIYRSAQLISQPESNRIQDLAKNYLETVIEHDWDIMTSGVMEGFVSDIIIDKIEAEFIGTHDFTFPKQQILRTAKTLRNTRSERIRLGNSALGTEIWIAILINSLVTIWINIPYRMDYRYHIFVLVSVVLVITSTLFIVIVLDYPFRGSFAVTKEPYEASLALLS